eukprot:7908872-Ditylum_brightwellii.AAC.1
MAGLEGLGEKDIALMTKHRQDKLSDVYMPKLEREVLKTMSGFEEDTAWCADGVLSVLPYFATVAAQDGIYWTRDFLNHDGSSYLSMQIPNYVQWTHTMLLEISQLENICDKTNMKYFNQGAQSVFNMLCRHVDKIDRLQRSDWMKRFQDLKIKIDAIAESVRTSQAQHQPEIVEVHTTMSTICRRFTENSVCVPPVHTVATTTSCPHIVVAAQPPATSATIPTSSRPPRTPTVHPRGRPPASVRTTNTVRTQATATNIAKTLPLRALQTQATAISFAKMFPLCALQT